jgi:hypothetical protein
MVLNAPRVRGRPFRPGQSGNPGGPPKGVIEVVALARAQTSAAIRALADIMQHGQSETARIAAANALLDLGWGRPREPIEIAPAGADLTTLSDEELERIIEATKNLCA